MEVRKYCPSCQSTDMMLVSEVVETFSNFGVTMHSLCATFICMDCGQETKEISV